MEHFWTSHVVPEISVQESRGPCYFAHAHLLGLLLLLLLLISLL